MLCYRDMTFCNYYIGCEKSKRGECGRELTEWVKDNAIRCELPICQYSEMPDCFEPKEGVSNGDTRT